MIEPCANTLQRSLSNTVSMLILPPRASNDGTWKMIYGQAVPYSTRDLHVAAATQQAAAEASCTWRTCHRFGQGPAARLSNDLAYQFAELLETNPVAAARIRGFKALRCFYRMLTSMAATKTCKRLPPTSSSVLSLKMLCRK